LQNLAHKLRLKGIALKAIEQPIDTSTAAGKAFLDMLGVICRIPDQYTPRTSTKGYC